MRLKSLYISQCKNLRDFSLSFNGNSSISFFVGKSNLCYSVHFEAFRLMFDFIKSKCPDGPGNED